MVNFLAYRKKMVYGSSRAFQPNILLTIIPSSLHLLYAPSIYVTVVLGQSNNGRVGGGRRKLVCPFVFNV
jgi:hypothetical protein